MSTDCEEIEEAIQSVRGSAVLRVWTGQENLHISTESRDVVERYRVDYPDRTRRGRYIDSFTLLALLSKHDYKVVSQ